MICRRWFVEVRPVPVPTRQCRSERRWSKEQWWGRTTTADAEGGGAAALCTSTSTRVFKFCLLCILVASAFCFLPVFFKKKVFKTMSFGIFWKKKKWVQAWTQNRQTTGFHPIYRFVSRFCARTVLRFVRTGRGSGSWLDRLNQSVWSNFDFIDYYYY